MSSLAASNNELSGCSSADADDLRGWLDSVKRLIPTPPEFREETIDRRAAMEMLRCNDSLLDTLVRYGLPSSGVAGEERFDRWDLFNIALYSRSRRSIPELSALVVARAAAAMPPTWIERREVRLALSLRCTRPGGCAADPHWLIRRPEPERFDGSITPWRASTTLQKATHPDDAVGMTAHAHTLLELAATVVTCGVKQTIHAEAVRALYWEIVHSMRFQVMPPALAVETHRVTKLGAVDCIAVATLLGEQCRQAGLETRIAKGLLLTMLGNGNHTWLEIKDDDGQWKSIDCSLAMISLGSSLANPVFAQFCLGSRFNRVLPFACPPLAPIVEHTCGGERCVVDVRVSISSVRSN